MSKKIFYTFYLIIILICPGLSLSAENYGRRFANLLPENYRKDITRLQAVSARLQRYSTIHPDLFYLYLNSLHETDEGQKYKGMLSDLESHFIRLKGSWLEKHLNEFRKTVSNDTTLRLIITELGRFIPEETPQEKHSITDRIEDRNEVDFTVVRYYDKTVPATYNPEYDYGTLREHIEHNRKEYLYKLVTDGADPGYVSSLIDNWYLFRDDDSDYTQVHKCIYDILSRYAVSTGRRLDSHGGFGINIGSGLNLLDINNTVFKAPVLEYVISRKSHAVSYGLSAFYQIPIIPTSAVFSHLHLGLAVSGLYISDYSDSGKKQNLYERGLDELTYTTDVRIKSAYRVIAHASTPLLTYDTNTHFRCGVALRMNSLKYAIDFTYFYSEYLYFYGQETELSASDRIEKQLDHMAIRPYLNVSFQIGDNWKATIAGSYDFFTSEFYFIID